MTIQVEFTPTEEARLFYAAQQSGIRLEELVRKIVSEHLPAVVPQGTPEVSAKNAAAIALLNGWVADEATDDPQEVEKADAEVNELLENLNRNRIESGERFLFP